ncbi:MAG TPA: hypothetical protein VJ349_13895, partial [Stellaceae bacterium]|nr:hypothetical protein [Stellaceae bacterium]
NRPICGRPASMRTAASPALLNALQGAEVRVTGAKPMSGRLLRVVAETARGADGRLRDFDRQTNPQSCNRPVRTLRCTIQGSQA